MRSRVSENITRESQSAGAEKDALVSVNEDEGNAKMALKNAQSLLMKGLAIPFLLCLQECGRNGWLILSVGSIVCYVLDLIRSAEGTLISIFLTLLVFAATLLYSLSSEVLEESWMNFPMLPAYCIIIIYTFIFCASHFTLAFQEMNFPLHVAFQVMFATLPLVASSIISVYLCEEVSAFELPVVFSCVYTVYLYFFGFPRVNYIQDVSRHRDAYKVKRTISYTERVFIHPIVLDIISMLVIPLSLLLSFSLHYNIPLTSRQAAASLMQSVFLPALLVFLCMKTHLPHHTHLSEEVKERRRGRYDRSIAAFAGALGMNMIDHPILDDVMKLGELDEDTASAVFVALIGSVILSYIFIRRIQTLQRQAEELPHGSSTPVWAHVYRICSLVCTSVTAGLLSLLIGMPYKVLPLFILGSAGLNEMYFQQWPPLYRLCLALLSSACFLLALPSFFKNNIYYLLFNWAWHIDLTMQRLCQVFITLILTAAFLPALLSRSHASIASALPTSITPMSSGQAFTKREVPLELRVLFAVGLSVFSTAISGLELLVLEQVSL
ncbi:hypothetical protein EON65_20725 [archaeon]|nr:MAG: hypothetical protein EON65_20725 [archaeon]